MRRIVGKRALLWRSRVGSEIFLSAMLGDNSIFKGLNLKWVFSPPLTPDLSPPSCNFIKA